MRLSRTGIRFVFHQKERVRRGCGKTIILQAGKYSFSSTLVKPLFDISVNHLFVGGLREGKICAQISP